jgi:hypothetical protein
MKRKQFIKAASLLAGGVIITNKIAAVKSTRSSSSCAPVSINQLTGTITSTKDGNWSDAATWGGAVPAAGDTIAVNHAVTYDIASGTYAGVNVNGTLIFAAGKSATLQSTKNIVVQGILRMRPSSVSFVHTIRFSGVSETSMAGGGMDVLASDNGLWVMGNGQLDLVGTSKTEWTRAVDSISAGATSIAVKDATGWQGNDEIIISPTEAPSVGDRFVTGFDERSVTGISGNTISIAAASNNHPKVNALWTAEVLNLTRNVRIEGTASGKSHIFIRSTRVQTIRYVGIRYMGPRKDNNGDGISEMMLGRYGLHFHHCEDGSIGSIVEGCVIRDTDNHAYVPHVSNGIMFKSNVAYNTTEIAFWWDEADSSHSITYDANVVAKCKYVNHSLALDSTSPTDPNLSGSGFLMGMGDDCVAINNVVAGCDNGDPGNGGAYFWQANNEGVWTFTNNMSHNCGNGMQVWQNTTLNHIVENQVTYHCSQALGHGAYANSYTYLGGTIYGNSMFIEASSGDSNRVRFINIAFDGGGMVDYGLVVSSSPIPSSYPTFVRNCSFKNFRLAGVHDAAGNELKTIDVINCTSTGVLATVHPQATAEEFIRIQPGSGQGTKLTKSGSTNIGPFTSSVWGNGTGLKGEYFNSNNLSNKVVERVDSVLAFQQWSTGVHHKITSNNHSVRWTGNVQAQYSEDYIFTVSTGGGIRLWVDSKLILDKWSDNYPAAFASSSLKLVAGQKYAIKLEYFNSDEKTGLNLYWQCASQQMEYVAQSQLFPDASTTSETPSVISPVVPPVEPPVTGATLSITASPNPARVSQNWRIIATSSVGGQIALTITTSQGVSKGSGTFASGQVIDFGTGLPIGTYFLTATQQGATTKTIQVIKQ